MPSFSVLFVGKLLFWVKGNTIFSRKSKYYVCQSQKKFRSLRYSLRRLLLLLFHYLAKSKNHLLERRNFIFTGNTEYMICKVNFWKNHSFGTHWKKKYGFWYGDTGIITAQKVFIFGVFLVCIFQHSDWIRTDSISLYSVRMRENTDQKNSEYQHTSSSVREKPRFFSW